MATLTKFYCFPKDVAEKVHNLSSDTLKVMLTNTAPERTVTVKSGITEITPGNGYTTGGFTLTVTSAAQSSGIYKLVVQDYTLSASSGGAISDWRYAVVYNSTTSNGNVIGFYDKGSTVSLAAGESVVFDFSQTDGILTIQ